ncbi:MAG: caspase family protein [Elusimicrobia bacterium]|nr:caspase family protein [Elusimicrobiota bacterium]
MRIPPARGPLPRWPWLLLTAMAMMVSGLQTAFSNESTGLLGKARTQAKSANNKAGTALASAPGQAGASTWVFIVSVLEWRDSKSYVSFPKENRRDALLVKFFRQKKGVPDDHILWFKDSDAALDKIRGRFSGLIKRAKPGDTLFFYYAGHGSLKAPGIAYLIPYDAKGGDAVPKTAWAMPDVIKAIAAEFKGAVAFVTADCCYSGALCDAARIQGGKVSFACLTSAQSGTPSTGGWTFSDTLLRGLTGSSRVDMNNDKQILFHELALYIEQEMSFEGQLSAYGATGEFDPRTKIADVSYQDSPAPPKVTVRWRDGKTYRAAVLGDCRTSDGKPGKKVDYIGWSDSSNECVAADTVGPYRPEPQKWALNSSVFVQSDEKWYASTVLDYKLGLYQVRYDGWAPYWTEWVAPDRVKDTKP